MLERASMVALSQSQPSPPVRLSLLNPRRLRRKKPPAKPHCTASLATNSRIPVIDLSTPGCEFLLVKACEDFGFFKVVNHGVPREFIAPLEDEAARFFNLPLCHKERAGLSSPLGYGNKKIGDNGDVGWLEYLLLSSSSDFISQLSLSVHPENPDKFSCAVKNYISAVRKMACQVLEAATQGLRMEQNDAFSRLLKDEESDSCFRLNHYPQYPPELEAPGGGKLLGFGEHTDPQIVSILRSNNTSGFQISTGHGNWVSVPADDNSFFVIVGDSLQVMTNGRFKSVKHRVLAEGRRSRTSMIFFGGPPLSEKIAPLPCLMGDGEESLYKEFTWKDYKKAMYKSRLADHRLGPFELKKVELRSKIADLNESHIPCKLRYRPRG